MGGGHFGFEISAPRLISEFEVVLQSSPSLTNAAGIDKTRHKER